MDLKPVGIFEGFSPAEIKKVTKQMREVRHPQGAEIMIRGDGGVGFLVILQGEADVATADGRHHKLGPGDHFGEMALLDHQGRSASVTVLRDHPEVTYRLLETLSRRLRDAEAATR